MVEFSRHLLFLSLITSVVSLDDLHNAAFTSLLSPSASFLALTSAPCSGLDPTTSSFFLSVNEVDNELPRVFPSFDLDLDSGMFSTLLSSSPSFTAMATALCLNAEDIVMSRDGRVSLSSGIRRTNNSYSIRVIRN